ncbi:MAG: polysulfide reductase NrfD [Chloroflexi bacterium]|nr:polysulfide reductase NrfD [Chloroflexota bacterium]
MPYSYSTIDEFRVGFDFQREWVHGRGLLLLLAFYLGGVGGGLYLASLLAGWDAGLLIGMGIVALGKGSAHLLFLGHPERFWRAMMRPQSSWISRGILFLGFFLLFGLAYYLFGGTPFLVLSAFFAFCLITYTGFVMAASPAISFWNNPLLPLVFITAALWSGGSVAEVFHSLASVEMDVDSLQVLSLVAGSAAVVVLFCYLVVNYYSTIAAKEAVLFLALGRLAWLFYAGVVALGLVVPLAVLVPAYLWGVPALALAVAGLSELVGSLFLRYALLRAGIFAPVL